MNTYQELLELIAAYRQEHPKATKQAIIDAYAENWKVNVFQLAIILRQQEPL